MELNKPKLKKTFPELFKAILTGNEKDSHASARAVRKLLYSSDNTGGFKEIGEIIENAPKEYFAISEDWRKENFVVSVSVLYYLHDKENEPDFLFSWTLYLLQNKNGNIRQSAVRMIENELGLLTVHIRIPNKNYAGDLQPDKADLILFSLFVALNDLIGCVWNPKYKKYKYIRSLPTGPYKSIQLVLCRIREDCGAEYMKQMKKRLSNLYSPPRRQSRGGRGGAGGE